MNLPSQAEVNAVTRHVATFAAGAITVFGLSTKLDPATIQQVIAATGSLVNDAILIIGLMAPLLTSYFSSKSANPAAQADAIVKAIPGTLIVTSDAVAGATTSPNILSHTEVKVMKR